MNIAGFLCALLLFPVKAADSHIASVSVEEGEAVTLKCAFPGNDEAGMQWVTPRGFTAFFNQHKVLRDGRFELRRFSKNRLNLRLSNITLEDEGIYSCLRYGDPVQSQETNVVVLAAPSYPVLSFTRFSGSGNADYTTLSCSTRGSKPPPRITWLIDNRTEVFGKTQVRLESNGKTCEANSTLRINTFSPNSHATCIVRHRTLRAGFLAASFTFQNITTDAQTTLPRSEVTSRPTAPLHTGYCQKDTNVQMFYSTLPEKSNFMEKEVKKEPVRFTKPETLMDPVTITELVILTDPVTLTEPTTVTAQKTYTELVTSPQPLGRNTSSSPTTGTRNLYNETDRINITAETVTSTSDLDPTHRHNTTNRDNTSSESGEIHSKSRGVLVLVMVSLMVCVLFVIFHLFLVKLKREHAKWRKESENSDQTLESTKSRSNHEDLMNPVKSAQATNQIPPILYAKEEIV